MANSNPDMMLTYMCKLLQSSAVTVRTISITYHNINFLVTYNLLHLTRFAYSTINSANQPFYMAKYIVASVLNWELVENDGVTPLPITFANLTQLEPALVAAIGKGLSDDYAGVINNITRSYCTVVPRI